MIIRWANECELDSINELRRQVNDIHAAGKPENPFRYAQDSLDIDEFCVHEAYRRQSITTAMVEFIKDYARERDFH